MIYPVSVVVPHTKSRAEFFHAVCLPSIERCNPAQIIVVDRAGEAQGKRNEGASKAMYDLLLFVDDDTELMPDCLGRMVEALEAYPWAQFAYSNRITVEYVDGRPHEDIAVARPWDLGELKKRNYVDTCSMIWKKAFPGFDPEIKRLQDWDLFLTIASRGGRGFFVNGQLYKKHHIDKGISDTVNFEESLSAIKRKHGLS
jgi:hypothetical protein